jgi:hypothetical protein
MIRRAKDMTFECVVLAVKENEWRKGIWRIKVREASSRTNQSDSIESRTNGALWSNWQRQTLTRTDPEYQGCLWLLSRRVSFTKDAVDRWRNKANRSSAAESDRGDDNELWRKLCIQTRRKVANGCVNNRPRAIKEVGAVLEKQTKVIDNCDGKLITICVLILNE